MLLNFVNNDFFEKFLLICVLANTIVLCLDNLVNDEIVSYLTTLNLFFTIFFTVDMVFKVIGMGPRDYIRDTFNIFDGVIVTLSIVELIIDSVSNTG